VSPLLQTLVVTVIVLTCTVSLLRRLAPKASWQAQARLSFLFERPGRPAWLHRIGVALRPPVVVVAKTCGSGGCNTCKACK